MKYCDGGDEIAHGFSAKDVDQYDERETDKKLDGIAGPHTCETFDGLCGGICTECPNLGKIKSPIVLGREFQEAVPTVVGWDAESTSKDVSVNVRPPCPFPFKWGKNPGIYRELPDEGGTQIVFDHNFYVEARFFDEGGEGECAAFVLELPFDGDRRFTAPIKELQTDASMRKTLSQHGVICDNWKAIELYVSRSLVELQLKKKALIANRQMGFTEDHTGFVVGDRVYRKGKKEPERNYETEYTRDLIKPLSPVGSFSEWKYTVNCYNRKGFELRQMLVCLGLASPLMEMIDNVATCGFHVYCKGSGVGKTTAMNASLTAWGKPENLRLTENDTDNSRMQRLAISNNLPGLMDEMTNTSPEKLSAIILAISEGAEKRRLNKNSTAKSELGSFSTLFAFTANTSILERISLGKHNPEAEAQRIVECMFEEMDWDDVDEDRFNAGMKHHYGHAGPIFIQYVLDNYDAVKKRLFAKRKYLCAKFGMTSKNRFWSAAYACILLAGEIAKELGLLEYDMAALEQYIGTLIEENQSNIDSQNHSVEELITKYLSEFHTGMVVIKSSRKSLEFSKEFTPKLYGRIVARYEEAAETLALDYGHFSHWLAENQAGAKETIKKILSEMNGKPVMKYNFTKGVSGMPLMRTKALLILNYAQVSDEEDIH
jgi:hypothetical protein